MCKSIDIDEQDWLEQYGKEVVERLLWEHSREQDKGDDGEMHHHHIYWATDMYESNGNGFRFFDEIEMENITGNFRKLVRPRADKSKEEQEKRTRDKAEVFTPSWVCNAQNNLIDEAWFGQPNIFNTTNENDHTWQATEGKIPFPTKDGKTWQDYVADTRLEMACGEAPYLVSLYDTTTGEPIPIHNRIGLLDRKLRVVNENADNSADWIFWAKVAIKNTYGFEWQGDNLLLAREAILKTFIEYYEQFAAEHNLTYRTPTNRTLQTVAYIISWNIFQMDGITKTLPMSGEKEKEYQTLQAPSLFDDPAPQAETVRGSNKIQNKRIFAKVADWRRDGESNHGTVYFKDIK